MWYTYILKSLEKKWYYVGSTDNLERRVNEHNKFKVQSTRFYAPLELVYKKEWHIEKEARDYEKKIKDKRKLKENILNNL